MKETELKPCPFCGGNNIVFVSCDETCCTKESDCKNYDCTTFAVCCDFNNGGCGAVGGYRTTKKEARDAWNRRANHE